MFICLSNGITEFECSALASCHGACPEAMKQALGLDDSCCGRCEADLETRIQRVCEDHAMPSERTRVHDQEARLTY
jgi:bacterioferritin-associated ferredoxin